MYRVSVEDCCYGLDGSTRPRQAKNTIYINDSLIDWHLGVSQHHANDSCCVVGRHTSLNKRLVRSRTSGNVCGCESVEIQCQPRSIKFDF